MLSQQRQGEAYTVFSAFFESEWKGSIAIVGFVLLSIQKQDLGNSGTLLIRHKILVLNIHMACEVASSFQMLFKHSKISKIN